LRSGKWKGRKEGMLCRVKKREGNAQGGEKKGWEQKGNGERREEEGRNRKR
jgi:hypothetical protein